MGRYHDDCSSSSDSSDAGASFATSGTHKSHKSKSAAAAVGSRRPSLSCAPHNSALAGASTMTRRSSISHAKIERRSSLSARAAASAAVPSIADSVIQHQKGEGNALTELDKRKAQREARLERCRQRIFKEKEAKEAEERKNVIAAKEVDMSYEARRDRTYQWYSRCGHPTRKNFEKRVKDMGKASGISVEDVDLLPWNATGTMVDVNGMNTPYVPPPPPTRTKSEELPPRTCSSSVPAPPVRSQSSDDLVGGGGGSDDSSVCSARSSRSTRSHLKIRRSKSKESSSSAVPSSSSSVCSSRSKSPRKRSSKSSSSKVVVETIAEKTEPATPITTKKKVVGGGEEQPITEQESPTTNSKSDDSPCKSSPSKSPSKTSTANKRYTSQELASPGGSNHSHGSDGSWGKLSASVHGPTKAAYPPPPPPPPPPPQPSSTTHAGGRSPMKRTPSANSGFGRRLSMAASRSGDLGAMVSSRIGRRSSLTHAPAVIGDGLDDEGSGHNSSNNNNEPYSSSPMVIDSPTKLSSSSSAAPNEKENEPYFSDDDDEYDDSALQNILKEIPNVSRSSNELNLEPPVPPAPAPAQQPSSPPGKAMRRGSAFAGMGMGGSFRSASGGSKKEEDVLAMMATEAHSVATGVCPVEYCVSESKPVVRIKSDENNEPSYLELNIFLRPKRLKRENQRSHFRIGKKSGSGTSTEKRGVGVC